MNSLRAGTEPFERCKLNIQQSSRLTPVLWLDVTASGQRKNLWKVLHQHSAEYKANT